MQSLMKFFKTNTFDQKIFLVLALSILLPFFIGGPILLIGACLLMYRHRSTLREEILSKGWLMIFILFTFLVALAFRNYIGAAVAVALFFMAMVFGYYYQQITAQLLLNQIKIFVWGSIPLALESCLAYAYYVFTNGYDLLYIFKYPNPQIRAEATFFNPNYYGLFIAMVVVMAFYLLIKSQDKLHRTLAALALFVNFIALILTASRWAIPTVLLGIVVMAFFWKPVLSWLLAFATGGVILALLVRPDLLPRFTSLAHAFDDRFTIWQAGWQMFETSPLLGRGPMAYLNAYYLFVDEGKMHAHQLFIDSLANYGLVGIMLLIMAFSNYFRRLAVTILNKKIRLELGLVIAILLTVLFHGAMDVGVFWLQTGYLFLSVLVVPEAILLDLSELSSESV